MKKSLLSLTLTLISCVTLGQWSGNPAVNNLVAGTTISTSKDNPRAVDDGNGNMIIAWAGTSAGGSTGKDIYVQKINKDGSLPWGTEKVLCNALNDQANVDITTDGNGGAIIVWDDERNSDSFKDIFAQRIDAGGNVLWTNGGVIVTVNSGNTTQKLLPFVEQVSSTEFMVVWRDQRRTTQDLFAQKCLISTGATQWTQDADIHGDQSGTQTTPDLLADGTGGLFVVWSDPRVSGADIYGQRISNSGSLLWGSSATVICDAGAGQNNPRLVSDNNGGFIVTWSDLRSSSTDANIYVQRVNDNGVSQWTANGVLICAAANTQSFPLIVDALDGNFIVAWADPRLAVNNRDVYAQKINLSGVAQWSADGVPVVVEANNQTNSGSELFLLASGSGTAIIGWADPRISTSDYNIYAQKLNSDGSAAFSTNGVQISTAPLNQSVPVAVLDGNGGVIIAWKDSRNATNSEIYASHLLSTGTLPVTFSSVSAKLNPVGTAAISWNIASEINTEKYFIERAVDANSFDVIGSIPASQKATYSFTDINPLSGSSYYRIKALDFDGKLSYSDVVNLNNTGFSPASVELYPNPVAESLNIKIPNSENQIFKVSITDLYGREILQAVFELRDGSDVLSLPLANVLSGTYLVKVRGAGGVVASKAIIKL